MVNNKTSTVDLILEREPGRHPSWQPGESLPAAEARSKTHKCCPPEFRDALLRKRELGKHRAQTILLNCVNRDGFNGGLDRTIHSRGSREGFWDAYRQTPAWEFDRFAALADNGSPYVAAPAGDPVARERLDVEASLHWTKAFLEDQPSLGG